MINYDDNDNKQNDSTIDITDLTSASTLDDGSLFIVQDNNQTDTNRYTSPDEFSKQVEEEAKNISMTDEEYDDLIKSLTDNLSCEEIIQKKKQKEKEKITSMILPDGYTNSYEEIVKDLPTVKDPADCLILCLEELGHIDVEYIAARCKKPLREVICYLVSKNAIYQNPKTWEKTFYKGWEMADEYLSGNLFIKYRLAKEASQEYPDLFERNIEAIEKLFPDKILSKDIYATIGSPWIPAKYYNDFLVHILNIRKIAGGVSYDTIFKKWKVSYSTHELNSRFDVLGMSAVDIFEHTLNNTPIKIFEKKFINGKFVSVVDKVKTLAAIERQKLMIQEFRNWIFEKPERKAQLENIYFEKYGSLTARKFDGSFLKLDGINPVVALYPHQRAAIARIIFSPACLLSHSVGTGKTYIMISAGMEMRRIGISKKNMYVVPNAIIEQWRQDFNFLYPNANVFVVDHRNMTPNKRGETLKKLRDGNYDAIIISYNSLKMIPISLRYKKAKLEARFNKIKALNNSRYSNMLAGISLELIEIEKKILEEKANKTKTIYFDDLGITSIFVDEAHNFKNISISTEGEFLRLLKNSSHQADDLLMKINLLRHKHVKSIVFATGTPITNSISDLFVMQTFLQPAELEFFGIDTFDSWALTFGEKTENFEMDVDSCNFRIIERFNKFHNLPELANIFSSVADFHVEDDDSLFLEIKRNTIEVPRSKEQTDYIKTLVERTERIRKKTPQKNQKNCKNGTPTNDNLLQVTNDGRRMALDIRLVVDGSVPTQKTKIDACADEVLRIYNNDPFVTQLVFCDVSTPKDKFNVYDELKSRLVALGIPELEIAYIQDGGNNATKRQKIIDALNDGFYKVLIGSTPMLGTGVNVQKRLFAVHHLDVPWRPSDMVQREGRMLRQGNSNNVVEIYRYVTSGSFDAYSWQLLESKQRFISQLLSGSLDKRDGDEVDSVALQYAEIKALAIGDPKIKDRVQTYNELSRLKLLKMHKIARRVSVESNLEAYQKNLETTKEQIKRLEMDYKIYLRNKDEKISYKEIGDKIIQECDKIDIRESSVEVAEMFGFKLVVPATCTPESPIFYLMSNYEKLFRLYNDKGVRLSNIEIAKQVDRYLSNLPDLIKDVNKKRLRLIRNIEQAKEELNIQEDLDTQIEFLTNKLIELDIQLGVIEDE